MCVRGWPTASGTHYRSARFSPNEGLTQNGRNEHHSALALRSLTLLSGIVLHKCSTRVYHTGHRSRSREANFSFCFSRLRHGPESLAGNPGSPAIHLPRFAVSSLPHRYSRLFRGLAAQPPNRDCILAVEATLNRQKSQSANSGLTVSGFGILTAASEFVSGRVRVRGWRRCAAGPANPMASD